jgi:hypothetical protein
MTRSDAPTISASLTHHDPTQPSLPVWAEHHG